MIEELARPVSPGTLYQMLHAMQRKGYLESRTERAGRSRRRLYRATPNGIEALTTAYGKIRELFREVVPGNQGAWACRPAGLGR